LHKVQQIKNRLQKKQFKENYRSAHSVEMKICAAVLGLRSRRRR